MEQETDPSIFATALAKVQGQQSGVDAAALHSGLRRTEIRAVRKSTAVTLLVMALLAGAGCLLLWPSQQREAQDHRQIATLQQQAAAVPAQINPLRQQVQKLAADFTAMKSQVSNQAGNIASGGNGPLAGVALALTQFRQATATGTPFGSALQLLQKTVGIQDPALGALLSKLAPAANQGVATPQALGSQFPAVAQAVIAASLQNTGGSLADRAKAGLNNIVEVRQNGALVSGNATQGQVDAAQAALASGNLAGAVASLQSLSGPALGAAQPWLNQAQLTMLAQRVGDVVGQQIATATGQGAGGLQYTTMGAGLTPGTVLNAAPVMGVAAPPAPQHPAQP